MQQTAINPWPWSLNFGYHQGLVIDGAQRQLFISGQAATDKDGNPLHPSDMRAQMQVMMANLEMVLAGAEMTLSHLVMLRLYSVNVDDTLQHYDMIAERLAAFDVKPTMTLLGVTRLAMAPLLCEVDAIAVA